MKRFILFLAQNIIYTSLLAQTIPYKIKWQYDVPITIAVTATGLLGLNTMQNKSGVDSAYVLRLNANDVNSFDRHAIGNRNPFYNKCSNIVLGIALIMPVSTFLQKSIRKDAAKIGLMYIETMALTLNSYSWTMSYTHRARPLMYDTNIPINEKLGKGTRNSFFAGHVTAAASASFFFAKVLSDYNPNSRFKFLFWTAAVIPPALVGFSRYKNGDHFPTDILVAFPVGMVIGILVPQLHKIKNKNLSFYPAHNGLSLSYRF